MKTFEKILLALTAICIAWSIYAAYGEGNSEAVCAWCSCAVWMVSWFVSRLACNEQKKLTELYKEQNDELYQVLRERSQVLDAAARVLQKQNEGQSHFTVH